jgi:hypothetical protein
MHMPPATTQEVWSRAEAPYDPADHPANAHALYSSLVQEPNHKPLIIAELVKGIALNHADTLPEAANFYSAVIASDSLWLSPRLRTQNGAWTAGISSIVSRFAPDTTLRNFFDTWPAAIPLFAGIATPEYKLDKVYGKNPTGAITDMSKIASIDEITDILTSMPEISYKLLRDDISATDLEHSIDLESPSQYFASSGDTISLAEHHIYGSSRLGVQRYPQFPSIGGAGGGFIANILNLPTADAANARTTLRNRVPWYSYPFADLIDSTKLSPYLEGSLTGNAYLGEWKTSRTLGYKYYEMTDHLGNVLATVLDRKTGFPSSGGAGVVYDHWLADLASTADYYPGGMMMPGRNTEYSWSRMGAQGSPKDDEVYGKGNLIDMGDRHLLTQINRTPKLDKDASNYPSVSPYSYVLNTFPNAIDPDGKNVFLITYLPDKSYSGHSAIAVENYRMVIQKVVKNGKTEYKTTYEKDGTSTIYELSGTVTSENPKDNAKMKVKGEYRGNGKGEVVKTSDIKNGITSTHANGSLPDGIIELTTSMETDAGIKNQMEVYAIQNPNYQGTSNNCTDYVVFGVGLATGGKVDAKEEPVSFWGKLSGLSGTTPNKAFTETEKAPNATVIKDPRKAGKDPNKSYEKSYKGEE